MHYDATNDKICKVCKFLPICMGGCPDDRVNREKNCVVHKYTLNSYIKEYVYKYLKEDFYEVLS